MKANRHILIYGKSLILGTIGISLRQCPRLEVTTVVSAIGAAQMIEALHADILLFDLEQTRMEEILSLLRINRAVVLMGISPDINLVKVWSGRQLQKISTQRLLEVILGEINNLNAESTGDEEGSYQTDKGYC